MDNLIDIFLQVIRKIEAGEIPYMVVGSIAAMVYGEPRLTHDMDLVVDINPADAAKFYNLFNSEDFYCLPLETVRSEIIQRGQFNLIHLKSSLKIDVVLRKITEHALEEFKRRRKMPFWSGVEVFLASPEDIIIKKLEFFRMGGSEKHLKDIRGILSESEIDKGYLELWIQKLSLSNEWGKI